MATIGQIVEQIRHAVFGKDVRENIAQGIEKCYEDAISDVDSKARGKIKNILFNNPFSALKTRDELSETTVAGITFTPVYENGEIVKIIANGTALSNAVYRYYMVSPSGYYKLSSNIRSSSTYVYVQKKEGSSFVTVCDNAPTGSYSDTYFYKEDEVYRMNLRITSGITVNNLSIYVGLISYRAHDSIIKYDDYQQISHQILDNSIAWFNDDNIINAVHTNESYYRQSIAVNNAGKFFIFNNDRSNNGNTLIEIVDDLSSYPNNKTDVIAVLGHCNDVTYDPINNHFLCVSGHEGVEGDVGPYDVVIIDGDTGERLSKVSIEENVDTRLNAIEFVNGFLYIASYDSLYKCDLNFENFEFINTMSRSILNSEVQQIVGNGTQTSYRQGMFYCDGMLIRPMALIYQNGVNDEIIYSTAVFNKYDLNGVEIGISVMDLTFPRSEIESATVINGVLYYITDGYYYKTIGKIYLHPFYKNKPHNILIKYGADFNDLVIPGEYSVRNAVTAQSLINKPEDLTTIFRMKIYLYGMGGVVQEVYPCLTNKYVVYKRIANNDEWSSWSKIESQ